MSDPDRFTDLIMELAQSSPELKAEIDKTFNRAQEIGLQFKAQVDALLKGGTHPREIIFGLLQQGVLLSYVEHSGNRGAARDDMSGLIDDLFNVIEDGALKSGATALMREMDAAKSRGDLITVGRLRAQIKRMREEQDARG